ncbi:MAG: phenylalanine--tRNA ligase subunit beta, partial [Halobacteria archaeon]|nr:phenylalanine--tRNA ligase subunit beta [Halobacteria archaeon]
VVEHLRRSGLDAEPENDGDETEYEVTVPPYRTDVMHPLDVVDDIGRSYGFNDLEPRYPDVSTVGSLTRSTRLENAVRKQLVGLGFQDLLNFVLTSPEANYDAVRLDEEEGDDPIRITNPYSEEYSMMRTWLIPSLVTVLSNNTHREYPQHLAEIGLCASRTDEGTESGSGVTGVKEETHVAAVLCGSDAGYEDAKSRLSSLVADFDVSLETPATEHPSFIDGRVADVVIDGDDVGVIGEIHPEVLAKNEITLPVAGFEFEMTSLEG